MRSLLRSNTLELDTLHQLIRTAQGFVDALDKARATGKSAGMKALTSSPEAVL